jgi:hypothetical protein
MKGKLTLSLDKKRIAKLRRASIRRKTSITALVEEFADRLESTGTMAGPSWVDELKGTLTGKLAQADLDADPRLAHIYRNGLKG